MCIYNHLQNLYSHLKSLFIRQSHKIFPSNWIFHRRHIVEDWWGAWLLGEYNVRITVLRSEQKVRISKPFYVQQNILDIFGTYSEHLYGR